MKNKKILFVLYIDNAIDLITNSSSELFVLTAKSKSLATNMIESVYPNYLNEYAEIKHINDLTLEELDSYFSYHCSPHMWPAKKSNYPIIPGFTFEELYEPEKDWQTGEEKKPAWNGEIQYKLRNNSSDKWGGFVIEENKEEILNKLDPERKMYFLYSLDENPDWDMQEKLMEVADRYHLG